MQNAERRGNKKYVTYDDDQTQSVSDLPTPLEKDSQGIVTVIATKVELEDVYEEVHIPTMTCKDFPNKVSVFSFQWFLHTK